MTVTGINKILMYFVRDHYDRMSDADITHAFKLFPSPNSPDRIVRVAEDKQLDLIRNNFIFKIFKVNSVFTI